MRLNEGGERWQNYSPDGREINSNRKLQKRRRSKVVVIVCSQHSWCNSNLYDVGSSTLHMFVSIIIIIITLEPCSCCASAPQSQMQNGRPSGGPTLAPG